MNRTHVTSHCLIRCASAVVAAAALGFTSTAGAQIVLDFEHAPFPTTPQPNNFAAAGAMQTYSVPGVFTITGGVVLGNPTFLASFPAQGSPPNLYGTADFADPSLLDTITLTMPAAENIVGVSGVLFNGQNAPEDYTVTYFSGATIEATSSFTSMPADFDSNGFGDFSGSTSLADPITMVTITTPNAGTNGWDFLVDNIDLTVGRSSSVPEPGSVAFLTAVGVSGGLLLRRRLRR